MKYAMLATAGLALATTATALPEQQGTGKLTLELGATANLATKDIVSDPIVGGIKVHTAGADLTAVYARNARHALTLRLSYASGEANESTLLGTQVYDVEGKLTSICLMPGYRYTRQLSKKVQAYAGAGIGLMLHQAKESESLDGQKWVDVKDSAYGLAAAGELGLVYAKSERLRFFAAYRLSASTARPELKWSDGETTYSAKLNAQTYHSLSVGAGWRF